MLRASAILAFCLAFLVPPALAAEKPMKYISCRTGSATILSASKEATVMILDSTGINAPGGTGLYADGSTNRCVGVVRIIKGKRKSNGYCKYLAPNGDYNLLEWTGSGKRGEGTWRYIYETGKWKGVKGGGAYKVIERGKPIVKGTYQFCLQATGTYEVAQ